MRLLRFYFITTNVTHAVAVRIDVFALVSYYIVLTDRSVPMVGFIIGPVFAIGVLMRLLDFSYISTNITCFVSFIIVDMFCHILDAAFLIRAFCIRALMPVILIVITPSTVSMLMARSIIDNHFACLCTIDIEP